MAASYGAPGVYIEEQPSGSMPIEGVGTAVAAFVGFTERYDTEQGDPTEVGTLDPVPRRRHARQRQRAEPDAQERHEVGAEGVEPDADEQERGAPRERHGDEQAPVGRPEGLLAGAGRDFEQP